MAGGSTFEPQAGAKSPAVPAAKSAAAAEFAPKSEKRLNMQMIPKVSIYDEPQFSHVLYNLGMTIG